ncbi:uncharacterized protein LOC112084601 [Eutrema salsugineum]|uniref:uncharacterized protein LOC112084601 n=1 Tax=Eutrema salsugineum TaxID=72664 RepID=UPI000CED1A57|nr:uncharacterized protein LOC112084601 [Eutrema salsugineum]
MFRSEATARELRWHSTNKSSDGKLRHPVDSVTWEHMDAKFPSFAAEERNIRLGLSTDGFNPFNMKNTRYSSWPVLLVNYNMAPNLCMAKENIMLSLLIPGPQQPGNSIDVYLEPLIDDLNQLWEKSVLTYDALSGTTFTLKAMLLWTISDLPASGNLAGCKVKEDTRKQKQTLVPVEECNSDSDEIDSESEDEEEVEIDEEELSRWKKRSIFFNLPYWEELPDGLNARKDLQVLGIRKDLHPRPQGKRTYLPAAPWSLSKEEKKIFCSRLHEFKGPDGYCSNISRSVSVDDPNIMGMKSHDYHVLMQQLLPVALRDREQIAVIEIEIVETLCMFERFFPPSFFDIMVHLCLHLGREARLGGPVHFRWMYPFERHMKILKDYVRNPARPEGCIAESYLSKKCMQFCNLFLKKTTSVEDIPERNVEYESRTILEGRPISAAKTITLNEIDKNIAHLAVLQNTALVEPYVE